MILNRLSQHIQILLLVLAAIVLRVVFERYLDVDYSIVIRLLSAGVILGVGAIYVLKGTADVIEETTEVLSEKTKLAGGVLQSIGTAFPDMVLGVVAAVVSLRLQATDFATAISFAIIAASTTFGSNIYNIAHAIWCIGRQNLANKRNLTVKMFPGWKNGGDVTPICKHIKKPQVVELDTAIDVLSALTFLTAIVAISMVVFGKVNLPPSNISGDLYQLVRPVGVVVLLLSIYFIYRFRAVTRVENPEEVIEEEERYYRKVPMWVIWIHLILSGLAILLAAESMVKAVQVFCTVTHVPFVVAGVAAGVIGCLGEMLVVHNYSVNPKGRIGDALVGVAMDNIVTTSGAAIVAIIGGIFLGGNALILIFVIILALNTFLISQISRLKNVLL